MYEGIDEDVLDNMFPLEAPLDAINLKELLELDIPPREQVLAPWLPVQGLAMIYAPRGVGKTMVGLSIAYAVAAGGDVLGWQAEKPRKVLYLDGEMPLVAMQERLKSISEKAGYELSNPDNLLLVNPDRQRKGFNLSTQEGQGRLEHLLDGVSLVIVDNISTLCGCGKENEAASWRPLQEWALMLRQRGLSVLFIHHAGKNGEQRGTSHREDVLDTVIKLQHSKAYDYKGGAQFEVCFKKARNITGDDVQDLFVQLTDEGWKVQPKENSMDERIIELEAEGLKQHEIAELLNVNKSTISRRLAKLRERGKL